jgi:hypothetical protein
VQRFFFLSFVPANNRASGASPPEFIPLTRTLGDTDIIFSFHMSKRCVSDYHFANQSRI